MTERRLYAIATIWIVLASDYLLNTLNLVTAFGVGGAWSSCDTHPCTYP